LEKKSPSIMYQQFCRFILERFFTDDLKGESLSLLIDDSVVQDFCVYINCEPESFSKMIYDAFWEDKSSLEGIIGIIAFEIYITSQRQADEVSSERAYNTRLVQFLQNSTPVKCNLNGNTVEKWYREHQDFYWKIFYDWCDENVYDVVRKASKKGRYRFVQYPLSFALLNKEDLSLFAHYFIEECNLSPNEELSFQDFCMIIIPITYGNKNQFAGLKNRYETIRYAQGEIVDKQLYSYYLRWDGVAPNIQAKKGNSSFSERSITNQYLSISDVYDKIRKYNRDWKQIEEIVVDTPKKMFDILTPFFDKSGTILFVKDPYYPEYVKGNRIESGEDGLIFINKTIPYWEFVKFKSYLNITIEQETSYYLLIKGKDSPAFSTWLHQEKKPYYLTGGLKIDRNTWMQFAGPLIEFNIDSSFFLNGEKLTVQKGDSLSLKDFPDGFYRLKFSNWPTTKFYISKPAIYFDHNESGWHIDKCGNWAFTDRSNLKGLDYSTYNKKESDSNPTRTWMELHSSRKNSITISKGESNVIKQLKRINNVTGNRIS
jgi:hypothetical protein